MTTRFQPNMNNWFELNLFKTIVTRYLAKYWVTSVLESRARDIRGTLAERSSCVGNDYFRPRNREIFCRRMSEWRRGYEYFQMEWYVHGARSERFSFVTALRALLWAITKTTRILQKTTEFVVFVRISRRNSAVLLTDFGVVKWRWSFLNEDNEDDIRTVTFRDVGTIFCARKENENVYESSLSLGYSQLSDTHPSTDSRGGCRSRRPICKFKVKYFVKNSNGSHSRSMRMWVTIQNLPELSSWNVRGVSLNKLT